MLTDVNTELENYKLKFRSEQHYNDQLLDLATSVSAKNVELQEYITEKENVDRLQQKLFDTKSNRANGLQNFFDKTFLGKLSFADETEFNEVAFTITVDYINSLGGKIAFKNNPSLPKDDKCQFATKNLYGALMQPFGNLNNDEIKNRYVKAIWKHLCVNDVKDEFFVIKTNK
jgi:hypothetical protein